MALDAVAGELSGELRRLLGLRLPVVPKLPLSSEEEQLNWFSGLLAKSQGPHWVLTVLYVPYSLDSGLRSAFSV